MDTKPVFAVALVMIAGVWVATSSGRLSAQAAAALVGTVASQEEGNMEGVLVNARAAGANFTTTVVSNTFGKYSFPADHLAPGKYTVTIRAGGYDLSAPTTIDVAAGKTATADLKLQKAKDLASQLTSLEWIASFPATPEEKDLFVHQLMSCAYCHTYQRIMKSKHNAEEFLPVIQRMLSYYADGTAVSGDGRGRAARIQEPGREAMEKDPRWGVVPGIPRPQLAEFIARYNLSGGKTAFGYDLKTGPRPHGQATHVIVTQYDMPTRGTVSHDSDIDSKGVVWYTDESAQILGKFEPKTAKFTEIPMPPVPAGNMPGTRDVVVDRDDNVWFPMRVPGNGAVLTKYEPATGKVTSVEGVGGQFIALGGDGSIWAGNTRVDPKTMQVTGKFSYNGDAKLPPGGNSGYHNVVDSKGNPWVATYRGPGGVIGINAQTKEVMWYPVPGLRARRGKMDPKDDKYWFAEYLTDKISMFDERTGLTQRWAAPQYSTPYTSSLPDKHGYVYAPSNMSERMYRLDPKTGEIVEYFMPTEFDTKKIAFDPTADHVVLWMSNERSARITKIEPLD
jgi:virginiamycin B lyase